LLGTLSVGIPFVVPDRAGEGAWGVMGSMAGTLGLGAAAMLTRARGGCAASMPGEGVIARWQVDPAVWTRFVVDDHAAERKRRKPDNAIRLKDRPGHAVDVIVGATAFKGAWLSGGRPSILELRFVTPGALRPDTTFRFTAAFGAETAT
jgi:hypothetical protein